jgi:ubiquinone/menaquinone biosynthesis C-methylase UbiE
LPPPNERATIYRNRTPNATDVTETSLSKAPEDRTLRGVYRIVAPIYPAFVALGSFGAFPRLYARAARALDVREGDRVLDLCCGTGLMFPFLAERVGETGKVVGVDFSRDMLDVAKRRIARRGFAQIELVEASATDYQPPAPFDGIVCCLCLSCVPDCEAVLKRVITFLKPGGTMVIVDAFLNTGRVHYALTNLQNRLKGAIIGAEPNNRLRETAAENLQNLSIEICHGGLYSLLRGTRPV